MKWIILNAVNKSHDSQSEIQLVRSSLDDQISEIEDGIFKARAFEYDNNIEFYYDYDQSLNVLIIELLSKSRRILEFSYQNIWNEKDLTLMPDLYLSLSKFLFYNIFNFSRMKLEKQMSLLYDLRVQGISGKITVI